MYIRKKHQIGMSSGFISEAELAERRRIRQEQWDKVRKPGQPEECPEEEYDPRSLFERLQEQKQKRELEYEEAHRLKNMIKGLDDDEIEFLDLVDRTKLEAERLKSQEEAREIRDFRDAVARQQERSIEDRINSEIRSRPPSTASSLSSASSRSSQARLLTGAVRKRRAPSPSSSTTTAVVDGGNSQPKKRPLENSNEQSKTEDDSGSSSDHAELNSCETEQNTSPASQNSVKNISSLHCIGILPGLGVYPDSSDSEQSSDTDAELTLSSGYDLLGRKLATGAGGAAARKAAQQQAKAADASGSEDVDPGSYDSCIEDDEYFSE
ncbi:PSME3-interacting protein isoform X3 [Schistocerca nitens]|uniref:PSME3-interacting protein isoform X3 n=1 Tax=Schistocerca nitens TaxID=7011 RepID=UPI00211874FD|nr:PSME3-interacting protein isoform X3 [Schistocerca nitens]